MNIFIFIQWSFFRIRAVFSLPLKVFQSLVDWSTMIYIFIPMVSFIVYGGYQYYYGLWFEGMSPDAPFFGILGFRSVISACTFVLFLLIYFSIF